MVQFATVLNPAITPLRIVTVRADVLRAALSSWMHIPLIAFEYNKGNPKKPISSSQGTRYFCQECEPL